jgi:hypothetical protein
MLLWCTTDAAGDVPMGKVKIGANQEYQYITNFKVLQKAFKDHGIDKVSSRFHSIRIHVLSCAKHGLPSRFCHYSRFLWTDSSSELLLVIPLRNLSDGDYTLQM